MSALVSVIPILLLIVLMMGFKVSGYKSAMITLVVTIILALFATPAMGIVPEKYAEASIFGITVWSVVEGFLKACFPIILIIICAIFSYNILCETKEIETIKTQFIQMTSDKGLLVLLLTWGLGGVLEGMAGFGTAVAIPAAILIGLGFKPMFSAVICLVANTVAVGFGAVGLPATTLANQVAASGVATPEELCEVATFIILQLALMFYITPFLILMITDRKKILKNIVSRRALTTNVSTQCLLLAAGKSCSFHRCTLGCRFGMYERGGLIYAIEFIREQYEELVQAETEGERRKIQGLLEDCYIPTVVMMLTICKEQLHMDIAEYRNALLGLMSQEGERNVVCVEERERAPRKNALDVHGFRAC